MSSTGLIWFKGRHGVSDGRDRAEFVSSVARG